ncbi:YdeI/OmpD-associated family protein [Flavobacteriaceae bacterium 3-367]|uniref:YdeI/OmpD-associated family protein n=1 Tax=Eudoraea algarum TaxID=3417568 RepID=UPI003273B1F2
MNHATTKYFIDRKKWRDWLLENHNKASEIWLVYPKVASGKLRIPYNDAVEEALCFGWIDSTVKSLDQDHTIQRFTPRRARSGYSQANKERLKWLFKEKKLHPRVEKSVGPIVREEFDFPVDIIDEIKKDKKAWAHYQAFSDPYKRIRIAYIDSARKRPDEFKKRLSNFITKTRGNKMIKGFGGIDKYY